MIKFRHIFTLSKPYNVQRILFVLFNVLTAVFNVFSIGMLIPFLKVIFNEEKSISEPVAFSLNPDKFMDYLDYQLNYWIIQWGDFNALIYFSAAIVIAFMLKNLFLYLSFYNLAYIRSAVVRDIRERLYTHILKLPIGYFHKEKRGDIISKLTNDIKEVEWSLLGVLEMFLKHPISLLIPLIWLFLTSYKLTLFVMLVLPISGFIISRIGKRLKNAASLGQEKLGELIAHIEESLHGIKILKAFNASKDKEEQFKTMNDDHFRLMVKLHRKEFLASPLSEFMGSLVIASILIYSGNLILNDNSGLSGSFLIAYVAIFSQLIPPAKKFTEGFFRVKKGAASLDRLNEIMNSGSEKDEISGLSASFTKSIEFKNVSFKYDQDDVLQNINLKIEAGQSIALVGPSGGGKSTLVDLIPRFYDVEQGEILIDGVNVKDLGLKSLRSLMGIVTQDAILFNDSVAGNIKMGDYYSTGDDVISAAKIANAHRFIKELPENYNTNIGEKGMNLSGGQRQRLSIARAVLKNPPILILDEATSALDTESERLVQDALEKVMQNRTSIVIAHRLSTIQNVDRIIVLDRGQIVEEGTHQELMAAKGTYFKLVELQMFS